MAVDPVSSGSAGSSPQGGDFAASLDRARKGNAGESGTEGGDAASNQQSNEQMQKLMVSGLQQSQTVMKQIIEEPIQEARSAEE